VTNDWNISAYWDDVDRANIREFIEVWSNFSPTFRVFGHDDILPLIAKYFPVYVAIFDAIRIPAAKADVARLILLYEFGGLYVDCHCGIRDKADTSRLLFSLVEREAVFIDRRLAQEPRPPDEHFLINSIMLSQPKSKLILMIARQALANLECHREFERLSGHIPYHIGSLTGPGLLTSLVLRPLNNREIRSDYRERVSIVREEISPIERNRHRTYGEPGQHWSVRQRSELLFKEELTE
jgi:Glycosyltransferase sugar-binding region containing DXD motif